MKKGLVLLIPLIMLGWQVYAQQASPPVKLLEIKDPKFEAFGPYKEPPVWFSHDLHAREYQIKCEYCHHHTNKVQKCSNCHGGSKQELTTAYHMRCWGCHEKIKSIYPQADVPTVSCDRCHINEADVGKEEKRIQAKLKHKKKKLEELIKTMKIKGFLK